MTLDSTLSYRSEGLDYMASSNNPAPALSEKHTVETRFGNITVNPEQGITLPFGPLGMPDLTRFCLTDMPGGKMQQFKLLQSLDDERITFITLPLPEKNPIIKEEDMARLLEDTGAKSESLVLMLIVSVHRLPTGETKLTVNARAPLVLDSGTRVGIQYVFPHDGYSMQHPLS